MGYHGIAQSPLSEDLSRLQVAPGRFRLQIELMLAAGFRFVTVAQFADELHDGEPPVGLAAISFDDGMRNNYTTALPILQSYGVPATVYVVVDLIGGRSPWIGPGGDGEMLAESELIELHRAGWEIGAHTLSHPDLSILDYGACRAQIEGGRDALARITGAQIETFAYPFGRYGTAALDAARDAGLRAAVTTGSGSWERYQLTRAMISAGDPLLVVLLKITDLYEPILRAPPLRVARGASKRLRDRLRRR